MNKNIKLSVIVTSYNHEKYISHAIDSILNQHVEFDFEIIIGDDFSSDNSRLLIENYARKYPELIHLVFPDQNLGGGVIFSKAVSLASGEYLAFLDGDDYWTSTEKLSRQLDFLQKNPESSLIFHNAIVKYEGLSDSHSWELNQQDQDAFLSTREIIHFRSIQTSTMMARRSALDAMANNNLISWHQMDDWMLALFASMHGSVAYMSEPMSVYRQHGDSEWSSLGRGEMCEKFIRRYESVRQYLPEELHGDLEFEVAQLSYEALLAYEKSGQFEKVAKLLERILSQENSIWLGVHAQSIGADKTGFRNSLARQLWLYSHPLVYRKVVACKPFFKLSNHFFHAFCRLSLRAYRLMRYGRICIINAFPNPAPATLPSGLGVTLLRWLSNKPFDMEIRVGSPDGPLFHRAFGMGGVRATGKWVADNTCFFLMDASKPPGWGSVIDFVCVAVSEEAGGEFDLDQLIALSDTGGPDTSLLEKQAQLNKSLSENRALIQDLKQKLKQLSDQVSEKQAILDDIVEQNGRLESLLGDRDVRITALETELKETLLSLAQQQSDIRDRHVIIERMGIDLYDISLQKSHFESQLKDRDVRVTALKTELNETLLSLAQQQSNTRDRHVIIEWMIVQTQIAHDLIESFQKRIFELEECNSQHQKLLDARDTLIRSLQAQNARRQQEDGDHGNAELRLLRQSISLRERDIKRLSDWAQNIHSNPAGYAFRRHAYLLGRRILLALPLSELNKRRFSGWVRDVTRSVRAALGSESAKKDEINESISASNLPNTLLPFKHNIFIFGVIDWHFRNQRPQQIARSLSRQGWRVFYFSNHFVDDSQPGYQVEQLDADGMLFQVKLHVSSAPQIYFAEPTYADQLMLDAGVTKLINNIDSMPAVMLIQHAYWQGAMSLLPGAIRVYDCMDHHEGFGNVPQGIIQAEEKIIDRADLVVVTSTWLEQFVGDKNQNVAVIRNACEYYHFEPVPTDCYSDPLRRKIIGYYGAIAEWFDLDLVRAVAEKYHDCLILLVGNDTVNASVELADLENVNFVGEIPYQTLPYYLHSFDVCLLPFKVIPLTLATNPVKVYEYLAAGKPVVCVDLPEIANQFKNLVWRAASASEFLENIAEAMKEGSNTSEQRERRRQFASMQTWEHRAEEFEQVLSYLVLPKISVIVLTYNNIELTKACLESILKESNYPNLELIIVDNASTDDTRNWLKIFAIEHPRVKVIINSSNLGFAAGNNIGLAAATGDYLVLLNNDTVVTHNWVMTLMHHLRDDPTIGLIGPVTNNIGNEARINIAYGSMDEMKVQAARYSRNHVGEVYPLRTAAFFCVMMHRSTYEKVGPLDEAFGRGFFEDDDYCRRIEKIGLRIVCAEDVFVHHHLSASFNKLKQAERQQLFEDNKKIYEAKWGEWIPHSYRPE